MKKLTDIQRANILTALVEGNSIASCTRMFGASKVTILRLLADAGTIAEEYHNAMVRNLPTEHVQLDEIWSFVGAKAKNVRPEIAGTGVGDCWTWVAMDADYKLVINWIVGGRDASFGHPFVADLADRLANRVQITTDGWGVYREAVKQAFGGEVDYATLVKEYATETPTNSRYSPSRIVSCSIAVRSGDPDPEHINTSYVERQNLTVRMSMRRFTRLTNGFSKKIQNHKWMIALHYFHYNFCRKHMTLKTTPAVAARISDRQWTMLEFVHMLEAAESSRGGRVTDYKMAASKRRDSAE